MFKRLVRLIFATHAMLLIAPSDLATAQTSPRVDYGIVQEIQVYRGSDNQPINVGTLVGGVAGGVLGHQIGSGRGQTAATILGAFGGAAIGHEVHEVHEKVNGSRYRITVKLESGTTLIFEDTRDINLRVGDRVRVENNRVYRV